jgi:hypothetical protein
MVRAPYQKSRWSSPIRSRTAQAENPLSWHRYHSHTLTRKSEQDINDDRKDITYE